MIKPYQKINTFRRPPVAAQIIAYIVFIGQALTFFICMYIHYASLTRQIVILVLYILTVVAQIVLTMVTSCSDPSDQIMIEYRNNVQERRNMNVEDCLYCDICTSYVNDTSRHCKVCQRCVQNFDHHCMWINNCVGSKNYGYFMAMTIVTFVNLIVYVAGMILLWTQNQWEQYLGSMIVLWIFSLLVAIFAILLVNLIGLHIYLIYKGMTTYQFIMLQRQQQKKKQQEQQEMERQMENRRNNERQGTMLSIVQGSTNQNLVQNQGVNLNKKQNEIAEERIPPVAFSQMQFARQQNARKRERQNQVIFGIGGESIENKTEKSEQAEQDRDRMPPHTKINKLNLQQNHQNDDEQPSSLNSAKQTQQNVSNFFTKNKSLKFFIGDQIGSRPMSSKNQKIVTKEKLFRSARVVEIQSKKSVLYESQRKYRKKSSSLQFQQENIPHKIKVEEFQQHKKNNQ